MSKTELLKGYRQKRHFEITTEPYGESEKLTQQPIFVIQKHDASHLHYDFRLEIGNVLVSWAIPKGPSTNPKVKRLAVRTEDHPLEYARLEGIIPEGEYGAGKVIVWDTGTFRNQTEKESRKLSLEEALQHGHITFWLEGKKLHGGYALSRIGPGENWLMVKMSDEKADARGNIIEAEPESVLSKQTIEEIK